MKKNLAIICGGHSSEYEVSVNSARVIFEHIDRTAYHVFLVFIEKESWFCLVNEEKILLNKEDFSISMQKKRIYFDVVLNMIHGTPGEDGVMQAYLSLLHIPQTACNLFTSALTFNKYFSNRFIESLEKVSVAKSIIVHQNEAIEPDKICEKITLPCFVKPNKGGSSKGTSKVSEKENLKEAINNAFLHDNEVMIEDMISGREITCGVIKTKQQLIAFPLTEIVSKKDFFDYEAKYTTGMAEEITPARISDEMKQDIQSLSKQLYQELNCSGVVRFDYIVSDGEIYFLEVNTIPGMSANSIVPQQARAYGWPLKRLINEMIEAVC